VGVGVRRVERRELSLERSGDIETTTEMEAGGEKTGEYEGEEDVSLTSGDIERMTKMEVGGEKTGEYEGEEDVSMQQSSNGSDHASDIAASPSSPS
jgi:hypothetical protein